MLAEHIILHMDYLMHLPHVYNEYIYAWSKQWKQVF